MWGGFALGAAVTVAVLLVLIALSTALNANRAIAVLQKRVNQMQRHIMDRHLMEMLDDGVIFDDELDADEGEGV